MVTPEHPGDVNLGDCPQIGSAPLPEPLDRPRLARWIWERGLDWRQAGELFGVSHMTVYLWCLPFGDPKRTEPRKAQAKNVERVTRGEIPAGSFRAAAAEAGCPDRPREARP